MKTKHSLKLYITAISALSLLALFGVFGVLHAPTKTYVQQLLNPAPRKVLSTAEGRLFDGRPIKVIKVVSSSGLFIEIYDFSKKTIHPLIDRIRLPDKNDGFINFNGAAVNLVLFDVDGDQQSEIIAPSFGSNLVAHMNVYTYNVETKTFELKNN